MSLQDHVTANQTSAAPTKAAREALLRAIASGVADVNSESGSLDAKLPRLKMLAETYALVVHGKE